MTSDLPIVFCENLVEDSKHFNRIVNSRDSY